MYTCTICLSLNHNARLHCQNCGTIPAKYSMLKRPAKSIDYRSMLSLDNQFIPVTALRGADRIERHHTTRCNLKTVTLDYYAEV